MSFDENLRTVARILQILCTANRNVSCSLASKRANSTFLRGQKYKKSFLNQYDQNADISRGKFSLLVARTLHLCYVILEISTF